MGVKSKFKIKKVDGSNPKYHQILCKLHRACFTDSEVEPDYEAGIWWIASESLSGLPVAFGGLALWNETTGYLERVGVLPKFRGRGLQSRLIRVRLSKARKLNLARVITYTSPSNTYSSNNLIKQGFKLYYPARQYPGHWLYWQKWL